MISFRRIPSVIVGAIGFAVLTAPVTSVAQAIDNRPIYYVMLKSLEDGFQAYNIALAAELKTRDAGLQARIESQRLAAAKEFEALETERTRRESAFNEKRVTLNERIATINEQITLRDGRISEQQRSQKHRAARYANDARIKILKERIATRLAEIDAIGTSYRTQSAATQKAKTALTGQIEEFMATGGPLAREIQSLDHDWQRFAEGERRRLKALADAYAVDYAAYDKWLEEERAVLEQAGTEVTSARESDRAQRALHAKTVAALRALVDEYNALVEMHNEASADEPGRGERALELGTLEKRIAELQAELTRAREAVLKVNQQLAKNNKEFTKRYRRFTIEKRQTEAALATNLAGLDAGRLTAEAAIDARRQKVDARVKTLEARISGEVQDARNSLETLSARLTEDFGRDHAGFGAAITRVLENNDDGLLYTASGAPRFDLSRPLTAAVYAAVELVDADRREVDMRIIAIEDSEDGAQQESSERPTVARSLEQDRAALSAQRQQLLEAHATFAKRHNARASTLEERQRAVDARHADDRRLLGDLYSARASLTRSEVQAVQRVLVAAAKDVLGTVSGNDDHVRLVIALQAKVGQMNAPEDVSLLAPHALLDQIASELPGGEVGSHSSGWRSFSSLEVTASRKLTGTDKVALASAWLAQLRRQARFVEIANALGASGAVMDGGQALSSLFMDGVLDHAAITEKRLDDGGVGIQVSILGRTYELVADGSLERLPGG